MGLRIFIKGTILVFLLYSEVLSETIFQSKSVNVETFENETVLLPCYIVDVDDSEERIRVRWYKYESLLGDSQDAHHLLPPRMKMHANYSLQIDQLQSEDSADYTCEIIRPDPWGPVKQMHTIKVQYLPVLHWSGIPSNTSGRQISSITDEIITRVAPTVKTVPEDGFMEVKKGEYVDIGCDASGLPAPTFEWKKNGDPMQLLEHRSRIRFKAEHRLLAGVYECTANNGVGDPVTATIRVVIHDAPVATAVRSFVHTAEGLRAVLSARLEFAVPPARTHWYRNGRPVKADERILMMVHDENVYQLIFRSVRKADFGNYTFRAENKLGMADVSFKLTGVPNVASFKVDHSLNRPSASSFTLIWEVDSYSTIIEYNLWLRPYYGHMTIPEPDSFTTETPGNKWSKIVVPGDAADGPIHSASYTVWGLTPSTVYEAIVTSRNSFGWSKPSSILHFATEPGVSRRPFTSDYSEAPVFEDVEDEEGYNSTQWVKQGRIEWNEENAGARETPSWSAILFLIGWTVFRF